MNLQWLYQLVITIVIGIIAYFLKDMKKTQDDKIKDVHVRIKDVHTRVDCVELASRQELEKMKDEFNQLKSDMPLVYVLRDDFIRAMGNVEKKLDKIYDVLSKKKEE